MLRAGGTFEGMGRPRTQAGRARETNRRLTGEYPIEIPANLTKQVLEHPDDPSAPERAMPVLGDDLERGLPVEEAARLFDRT